MPSKSPDAFRTISEVAEWLNTPAHVLRFWESKFSQVKPVKRAGGRRYYRPADMELIGGIKKLLHDDAMTIKGVQKVLREQGIKHVASLSPPLDEDIENMIAPLPAPPAPEPERAPPEPAAGQVLDFTPRQEEQDDLDDLPETERMPETEPARASGDLFDDVDADDGENIFSDSDAGEIADSAEHEDHLADLSDAAEEPAETAAEGDGVDAVAEEPVQPASLPSFLQKPMSERIESDAPEPAETADDDLQDLLPTAIPDDVAVESEAALSAEYEPEHEQAVEDLELEPEEAELYPAEPEPEQAEPESLQEAMPGEEQAATTPTIPKIEVRADPQDSDIAADPGILPRLAACLSNGRPLPAEEARDLITRLQTLKRNMTDGAHG